uniref:NADH-ubiquinone oxidoreductase chain 5 n=1 Tax=Ophiomusa kimblae TaxID=3135533 RepID=A0AAU6PX88_9ECHI
MFLLILTLIALILFLLLFSIGNKNSGVSVVGLLSLLAGSIFCFSYIGGNPTVIISVTWLNSSLQGFKFSFLLDPSFVLFSSCGLFVTWAILCFSQYYMPPDDNKSTFTAGLIFFLLFMLILTSSNSLFLLFVGWEGVGILSFFLIGWWHTRADANSAALQAIIYNRLGDGGFILFLAIAIVFYDSWELTELVHLTNGSLPLSWAVLGIILAAAGKSAQFGLHPWLPAAMEGPTPVSALLHSSTMVVAGVYLLLRCSPLITSFPWALSLILILGSLTALYAGSVALFQYDIKKVIAYSTTSQLGLMLVSLGLGLPHLALYHICTHAFFKSLLFLCSGSIIHNNNNEQDLRYLNNSFSALPLTSSCLLVGSLALCGLPTLGGFYSKDLILEVAQISPINFFAVVAALIATLLTMLYSFRLIFYLSRNTHTNTLQANSEENSYLTLPLLQLALGAIIAGWSLSLSLFHISPSFLPLFQKSLPLIMLLYGGSIAFSSFWNHSFNQTETFFIHFLVSSWFYTQVSHGHTSLISYFSSTLGVLRTLDQGWLSYWGPTGILQSVNHFSTLLHYAHSALLSNYFLFLSLFILTAVLLLFAI